MDCKEFQNELPDLLLTPNSTPSVAAVAHLKSCPPCTEEYVSFQQTFGLLDTWAPIEPTPFFDGKLNARIREVQAAPAMSWFERLQTRLLFNTGRHFRPAMAGALSLALLLGIGGGSYISISHPGPVPAEASAAVNDLQILDRNDQAYQQMDELQQDEDSPAQTENAPQDSQGPTT